MKKKYVAAAKAKTKLRKKKQRIIETKTGSRSSIKPSGKGNFNSWSSSITHSVYTFIYMYITICVYKYI